MEQRKEGISAQIIADSICNGHRITTMVVTMPRYILAEFNTHRMFSRNSASSRAIPFEKMVRTVKENPFVPMAWQKDHKGMQGTGYLDSLPHDEVFPGLELLDTKSVHAYIADSWLEARDTAVEQAVMLSEINVTKQLCNRLLEPFMWHTVLVTATEFSNFFELRCPQYEIEVLIAEHPVYFRSRKDVIAYWGNGPSLADLTELEWLNANKGQADIHMMATAEAMWDAFNVSTPKELKAGEWHIPFGDQVDMSWKTQYDDGTTITGKLNPILHANDIEQRLIQVATARCAHVSYTVVGEEDKPIPIEKYIELHDRLKASGHWSPFEHCARAMTMNEQLTHINGECEPELEDSPENGDLIIPFDTSKGWCRNFRGWIQYRSLVDQSS